MENDTREMVRIEQSQTTSLVAGLTALLPRIGPLSAGNNVVYRGP